MSDDDQRVIDALMAAQRKNRKIIPCPECERLQLEADCAGKNAAKYHDIIREQRREIERLRAALERIANAYKHDSVAGDMAREALEGER